MFGVLEYLASVTDAAIEATEKVKADKANNVVADSFKIVAAECDANLTFLLFKYHYP
ncbi:hypothetical protein TUM3792_06310 [Shewanella sp. MBTL60-007]|nr:hypothetical protein TUM3792_06310 [Shewanella sp. MBTL60-007]